MTQARSGALIAIIVFGAFAAYAFFAPATYRTSALVVVDAATLPEPLDAARRLSDAVLNRKTLESLSRERAGSSAPDAQAQASSGVRRGLEIDTSDAHTFSISYRDSNAARAQRACNQLAKRAVEVAPLVLVDHSAERALDLRRQEQTQLLAEFLAQHPQVATEPGASGDKPLEQDRAFSALTAERSNLEHRILELESGAASDNPYVDPRESNVKLLRRRLAEINSGLSARRQAFDGKQASVQLPPEALAEWKRLLDAIAESSADAQPDAHLALVARLAMPAPFPGSPIDPNRRLLLLFGVVFGVGLGAAFVLAARASQHRRSRSNRPPLPAPAVPSALSATLPAPFATLPVPATLLVPATPALNALPAPGALLPQTGSTMQLPAPPALPSGLGPALPISPPSSDPAPPIVPMPQRPISASPSGYGPDATTDARFEVSSAQGMLGAAEERNTSSSRPPRRFASTLVLPPAENPTRDDQPTPDPVLASAARAWDQQIRAHDVPGFAVVMPESDSPQPAATGALDSEVYSVEPSASDPPAAATAQRSAPWAPNQMKVTQPLGSFSPEALWNETIKEAARSPHTAPRSPLPIRPASPGPGSQYSYVSSSPPPASAPVSSSKKHVVRVQEVPRTWRPDPKLTPQAQRPLCEQLVPFAVESCFVLTVVSVPESAGYKSRVAAELVLALAESEHPRVLLLEGDLHRPWVTRMMGVVMPLSSGFSQQLNARAQGASDERWSVLGCTRSLHVLGEGMMRSPGLLLSKQFAICLDELRTYYDFIVIDGPTASIDVDSGPINAVSDGLLTVCPAKGSKALERMQARFTQKRFSAFATAP